MSDIAGLDARMTRIETDMKSGFDRIEDLLRQEIADLKNDQITELRKANDRLSDDQRRLWDLLHSLELRESDRAGADRKMRSLGHFISALFGGAVSYAVAWLIGFAGRH